MFVRIGLAWITCGILAAAAPAESPGLPAALKSAESAEAALKRALPAERPDNQIVAVESQAKSKYAARADGVFLFQAGAHPREDVLTLRLKAGGGGRFLRLDFPTDPSLPANGPGLAGNGNSVIGEIEIEVAGEPVKARAHAVVSQSHGGREAALAFDGVKQQGDKGWDGEASGWELGMGKAASLTAMLAEDVPAGADVIVRLIAKSKWNQHVPGTVSAAIVGGPDAVRALAEAKKSRAEFDRWRESIASRLKEPLARTDAGSAIEKQPALRAVLAQAELLRACGDDKVWSVLIRKGGYSFLSTFLADPPWLESFLQGGSEGTTRADYAQALENLRLLHSRIDAQKWSDPVNVRLATAMSLQAGAMNRYRFVERFGLIEKARLDGLLHAGFDRLDVRAMRHAINLGGTRADFEFLLHDTRFRGGDYLGACWGVPYVDPSVYGFSIQGWGFFDPLAHGYPRASLPRKLGGVCGSLSGYGAATAVTHGVPAFTVGQPGHCAYVVRIGDHWATGNDVSGPDTNSWSAYEGVHFGTTDRLLERIENDADFPRIVRLTWIARQQRKGGDAALWQATYDSAIAAQPLDYAVWLEYVKALETDVKTTPEAWLALGKRAAKAFREHHDAGWALALRCFKNGKPPTPTERVALLLETHQALSQKSEPKMYGYPIHAVLHRQADWIGDPAAAVGFYGKLLTLHYSERPETNWVFGHVMSWGSERFGRNPAVAAQYARAVGDFIETNGRLDKNFKATVISQGIRAASVSGDRPAYATWVALADKLLPPVTPGEIHLNPQQAAAHPKMEPFPGQLLSSEGMLRSSSACGHDRPLSYKSILSAGTGGWLHTNVEAKPWLQVDLPGDGELSGIVLVGRYEFPKESPTRTGALPMKVLTSSDGKNWTDAATFDAVQDVYRIDLQSQKTRARFVRVERVPAAGQAAADFEFRNVLIYGRKSY